MELYKKYRPTSFKRIAGNEEACNLLEGWNDLPHAILLTGPSGSGKTTIARILKDKLSCAEMDYQEVNAADFRGVETIRNVRSIMHLAPMSDSRVWLIDEVHKLTNDAQNAFLKLLEEPPSYVYFILATTEPEKLITTLKSRCTEIKLQALKYKDLKRLIKRILRKENSDINDDILDSIIELSEGNARKALVLLEQTLKLPVDERYEYVKTSDSNTKELAKLLLHGSSWNQVAKCLKSLKEEPETVRYGVLGYARKVLLGGGPKASAAFLIIDAFRENFYDSKSAGLAAACYEVVEVLTAYENPTKSKEIG